MGLISIVHRFHIDPVGQTQRLNALPRREAPVPWSLHHHGSIPSVAIDIVYVQCCAPIRVSALSAQKCRTLRYSRSPFKQTPCYPSASKPLTSNHYQMIPIRYNGFVIRHHSSVPSEPSP